MEDKRHLNAEIDKSIAEFKDAMKEFMLKNRLYRKLLRGKGLDFDSYREYAQDDDAQMIDWRASMRSNKLLIKQYTQEKNLKIVFLVDVGTNMVFGSANKLKCEYAAEVVAALSSLVISSGDNAGFILFNDKIKEYFKPAAGSKSFDYLIGAITNANNYDAASNMEKALRFTYEYINSSIDSIVIVSDFVSFNERCVKELSFVSAKFETMVIMVRDPLDRTLPDISTEVVIEDPRTGEQMVINPKVAREMYEQKAREQEAFVRKTCQNNGVDILELSTTEPFIPSLTEFMKGRSQPTI